MFQFFKDVIQSYKLFKIVQKENDDLFKEDFNDLIKCLCCNHIAAEILIKHIKENINLLPSKPLNTGST